MPASMPPVNVGDDVIISLREKLWPIVDANESNPEFKQLSMGQLYSVQGSALQRYYDWPAEKRIAQAQYETGQKVVEWWGAENPYPDPGFNFIHPSPLVGVIGVNGTEYVDANGSCYPLGVHFGDGFLCMTEGRDVEPMLDTFTELGYHFDRSWITLMYNKQGYPGHFWGTRGCSPRVTPNYFNWLRRWIEMHIDRKLKMHLSMGDLNNVPRNELFDLYTNLSNLVRIYGEEHFFLPGEVNESFATFQNGTPEYINELVSIIRRDNPNVLLALTACGGYVPPEILKDFTPSWQKIYYKHGYRDGEWWDKIRHYFSDGYEYYGKLLRPVGADHEPLGWGKYVSATAGMGDIDANVLSLCAVASVITRQSFVYFCSPGIKWEDQDFNAAPGFHTIPRLVAMLPKGLGKGILHHSGTRWMGTRVFSAVNEFRVDGSINEATGEGAYVCYGPGNRIKLPVNRSFDGQIINPETLEVSNISARSGENLPEIGYNKGFVITVKLK